MCILLNVKKHEKTFALNVDIFNIPMRINFAIAISKRSCYNSQADKIWSKLETHNPPG